MSALRIESDTGTAADVGTVEGVFTVSVALVLDIREDSTGSPKGGLLLSLKATFGPTEGFTGVILVVSPLDSFSAFSAVPVAALDTLFGGIFFFDDSADVEPDSLDAFFVVGLLGTAALTVAPNRSTTTVGCGGCAFDVIDVL